MASKRKQMVERRNRLIALRFNANARYDLIRDLGVGVKNGHWFAYLYDTTDRWKRVWAVTDCKRVSRKREIQFEVACSMLEEQYHRSNAQLVLAMQDWYEQQQNPTQER